MKFPQLHQIRPYLPLLVLSVFLFLLFEALHHYHYEEIVRELRQTPPPLIIWALGLTVLNYTLLTLYDALGFRYVSKDLPYSKIAFSSFVSYAFSYNLGFPLLSGSATRFRFYAAWGVSSIEIAKIIAFSSFHFWLGLSLLSGASLLVKPDIIVEMTGVSSFWSYGVGVLLLAPTIAYLGLAFRGVADIAIRSIVVTIPPFRLALGALLVAIFDWLLAASILYVLLVHVGAVPFLDLLASFFVGHSVGVLSHVPGGIGVFESVVSFGLREYLAPSSLIAALLLFRIIYYLVPFAAALALLAFYEVWRRREQMARALKPVERVLGELMPAYLSLASFISGAILLFSGATPTLSPRVKWIGEILPLPALEFSHFLNSIVGVGLLVLAQGLRKRVNSAYLLAVVLLITGVIVSIVKGFDFEEAMILSVVLLTLLPCRSYFYRKSSLLSTFTKRGIVAVAAVVFSAIWLGLFSYKHVEYRQELWWHFTLEGDASRFLRGGVGAMASLLIVSLTAVFQPVRKYGSYPGDAELERTRAIIERYPSSFGPLVYLRDKFVLFAEGDRGFLMYRISGRSWIALGDPIGDEEARSELIWKFRDLCDHYDGLPVFYEVSARNLPLYLDIGLSPLKIGEEARVDLKNFSLEGSHFKSLRSSIRKLERDGYTFQVVKAEEVEHYLSELKAISDEWLKEKEGAEKGFSLGFFSDDYIRRFPVALVIKDEKVLAFANVWTSSSKELLSIDLMRHRTNAHGVMDFLFIQLFQWGRNEGYELFNLGMAPFSGLEMHKFAPLWNRAGAIVFDKGEHFYRFEGLRRYKEKFRPHWEPKYLASPAGFLLPIVLTNLATLIGDRSSGGTKEVHDDKAP